MNKHAKNLKKYLPTLTNEMAASPEVLSNVEKPCCCRKRKFDFSTVLKVILSFASNALGYELGEFFDYCDGFPSVFAFVQQRQKLGYTAFEHLFHKFSFRKST